MEEEKKNKLKKILSYIGCGIGCFILGLCVSNCANNKGKKANNVNNNTQNEVVQNVQHKEIQFNDVSYQIIFDTYDLNNCYYPSFAELISVDYSSLSISQWLFVYDHITFSFEDNDGEIFQFNDVEDIGLSIIFDYATQGSLGSFTYNNGTYDLPFTSSLKFSVTESDYGYVQEAIQLDIEYNNEHYQQSIFGGLTESLGDFIGVIGSGFTSVFTIFYASGHITTFGTLSLIVVGVAIAYFLFRFIIGLIRLRG